MITNCGDNLLIVTNDNQLLRISSNIFASVHKTCKLEKNYIPILKKSPITHIQFINRQLFVVH